MDLGSGLLAEGINLYNIGCNGQMRHGHKARMSGPPAWHNN